MEDAHTVQLQLDEDKRAQNSFFAVFDGHGGVLLKLAPSLSFVKRSTGSSVARYAGQNVWKRLAQEPAYLEGRYPEALKKAFLGTDEDILKGDVIFWSCAS
jgi:protein phosphatase 2C family protein 2/3